MIYLFTEKKSETKDKVTAVYFNPSDLTDSQKDAAVKLDSYPEVEELPGKNSVMYFNHTENKFQVEYVDRPLTAQEELAKLKQEQEVMRQAIDDLIFGGAF